MHGSTLPENQSTNLAALHWPQALRRATWMPEVPAHRVIKASGDIGGFGGTAGLSQGPVQRKKRLLEAEGLEFQGSQLVTSDALLGADELIELVAVD
jgi:alkylated DNA nucleotide flippase Atl1